LPVPVLADQQDRRADGQRLLDLLRELLERRAAADEPARNVLGFGSGSGADARALALEILKLDAPRFNVAMSSSTRNGFWR